MKPILVAWLVALAGTAGGTLGLLVAPTFWKARAAFWKNYAVIVERELDEAHAPAIRPTLDFPRPISGRVGAESAS